MNHALWQAKRNRACLDGIKFGRLILDDIHNLEETISTAVIREVPLRSYGTGGPFAAATIAGLVWGTA